MKILLIGGTGYIGRAVAAAAGEAGHEVTVLSRSDASDAKLDGAPVTIVRGAVEDVDTITEAARRADAVAYLAVGGFAGATPADHAAIEAVLSAFEGTGKTFVLTSGLGVFGGSPVTIVTPETSTDARVEAQAWRADLERSVLDASDRGISTAIIRPSIVYGRGTASPIVLRYLAHVAGGGVPFYLGTGANSIATVHVDDLATVFVRTLESAPQALAVNVGTGHVLGLDLALAAAAVTGSALTPESVDAKGAIAAMGPAGLAVGLDIAISAWQLTHDLAVTPVGEPFLRALVGGDILAD